MAKAGQWKAACWVFYADKRAAIRSRHRQRKDDPFRTRPTRIRKACPTCVEHALAKPCFAQTDSWCEGYCKKHAKEKGLKKPERRRKACGDQAKKSQARKSAVQERGKKQSEDHGEAKAMAEATDKNLQPPSKKRKMWKLKAQVHSATELSSDDGTDEGADFKDEIHVIILASTSTLRYFSFSELFIN